MHVVHQSQYPVCIHLLCIELKRSTQRVKYGVTCCATHGGRQEDSTSISAPESTKERDQRLGQRKHSLLWPPSVVQEGLGPSHQSLLYIMPNVSRVDESHKL